MTEGEDRLQPSKIMIVELYKQWENIYTDQYNVFQPKWKKETEIKNKPQTTGIRK